MSKPQLLYCVTDKELFDLMTASKQSITDSILLSIARERGILYAPNETREALINTLSLLPYAYDDLEIILDHRATSQRTEKRTSITLRGAMNMDDIKAVCTDYREAAPADESVATTQDGTHKLTATVNYSELDYSKTRLLQRRAKEADIEFIVKDDETIIRMPANQKARAITAALKEGLEKRLHAQIASDEIDVSRLNSHGLRTLFFTSLIGEMDGYLLHDVMDVKVEPKSKLYHPQEDALDVEPNTDDDMEIEELSSEAEADAKEAMMSVVENVALKGSLLLNSPEYQQLREKGFYITSIIWISQQKYSPYDNVEFEAGFENPREGTGFKYNVRGVYRNINGTTTKTMRQITKEERPFFFALIESTARLVLTRLTIEANQTGKEEE